MQTKSKYNRMQPLAFDAATWGDGFWGRLSSIVSRKLYCRACGEALDEPENGAVFSNFAIAAGLREGERKGTMWSDGDCYKYMEALARISSAHQGAVHH